ncbi:hypothetical protein [Klebsiella phage vB_KpnS-VAC51]|uniref:Uncharacterized protein n=1 Tax=Klebsiella phage vB_KpnS-VAC51 TaxID=2866698 RepID=A0AAE8YE09_9CAUD|nr:hypothetical protein [Klebsiella phage vB_KpnS-VAC51]
MSFSGSTPSLLPLVRSPCFSLVEQAKVRFHHFSKIRRRVYEIPGQLRGFTKGLESVCRSRLIGRIYRTRRHGSIR